MSAARLPPRALERPVPGLASGLWMVTCPLPVSVRTSLLYGRQVGAQPTLTTSLLNSDLYKDLVSKQGHIPTYVGLGLHYINWGGGMFQPRTGHFERRARGQCGVHAVECLQPGPAPPHRNPWDSGSSSSWGKIGLSCWPLAPWLWCWELGTSRGPGRAGQCQPGRRPQLAGPEKASCEAEVFETLTNKVFFSSKLNESVASYRTSSVHPIAAKVSDSSPRPIQNQTSLGGICSTTRFVSVLFSWWKGGL